MNGGPEINSEIVAKIDEILATLKRIEERQIKTTKMVEDVKENEVPVGSFATGYQKPNE